MPTLPKDGTRIPYSRWEPINEDDDDRDEDDEGRNQVEFHRFEEESSASKKRSLFPSLSVSFRSKPHRKISSRKRLFTISSGRSAPPSVITAGESTPSAIWQWAVKLLIACIVFGIGWIAGFTVRWGIHKFYIDPMGHCVTPVPYQYNPDIVTEAMNSIKLESIKMFFSDFTALTRNRSFRDIGSQASEEFAHSISELWKEFGLDQVGLDTVNQKIPVTSKPSEIIIRDQAGNLVWKRTLPELHGHVAYSASATGKGRLVYGHFGRYQDLHDLQNTYNLTFKDSVVILKANHQFYHAGSMVRNAQLFGAKAVVFFPDPNSYILTREGLGNLHANVSVSHSVKFVPGDPHSPYVASHLNKTLPKIPVVSISYSDANVLLRQFTNAFHIDKAYWFGLPLNTSSENDYETSVSVHSEYESETLFNVLGTIPGRYEPTRYVLIGSHHDTWHQGASKPGIGHSVLMELAKGFGLLYKQGWKPGRSLVFASWDGEEFGDLGSTSWLYRHSKELASRGVAYINMDFLLQGSDEIHLSFSPLFRKILEISAETMACPEDSEQLNLQESSYFESKNGIPPCQLFTDITKVFKGHANNEEAVRQLGSTTDSGFQNMVGISTVQIAVKNRHSSGGDSYPFVNSPMDTASKAELFLELGHAKQVAKFLVIVIMQLVTPAQLPFNSTDYGTQVESDLKAFLFKYADSLTRNSIQFNDIKRASEQFVVTSENFHSNYDPSPSLDMLAHHEFNDQLLELERSFLLPSFADPLSENHPLADILEGPFRQVIYGPSPFNLGKSSFLPRLSAAIEVAKLDNSPRSWNIVQREIFFVVDALTSAKCVLDNHLIFPEHGHKL